MKKTTFTATAFVLVALLLGLLMWAGSGDFVGKAFYVSGSSSKSLPGQMEKATFELFKNGCIIEFGTSGVYKLDSVFKACSCVYDGTYEGKDITNCPKLFKQTETQKDTRVPPDKESKAVLTACTLSYKNTILYSSSSTSSYCNCLSKAITGRTKTENIFNSCEPKLLPSLPLPLKTLKEELIPLKNTTISKRTKVSAQSGR